MSYVKLHVHSLVDKLKYPKYYSIFFRVSLLYETSKAEGLYVVLGVAIRYRLSETRGVGWESSSVILVAEILLD